MKRLISRRKLLVAGAGMSMIGAASALFGFRRRYKAPLKGRPVPRRSLFDGSSTAEQVTEGIDLSGRLALVTGCNSGLGYETMRVLAMRGAHVIGAARTLEKAQEACASVDGKTTPLVVELTDLPGIATAASQVVEMDTPLDMLILNAGIMSLPELRVANGVEMQFAVNHLGHFLLANRLLEPLIAAPEGRVIVLSSRAHTWAPAEGIQFSNLSGDEGYDPRQAYGQSKLANGLFSRELARRMAATNATSNSLHPGVIETNLGRHMSAREKSASFANGKTIPRGAATQCYVATSPDLDGVTGYYFDDCNPANPSHHMQDDEMAAKLWQVSEELVADFL